MTYNQMISKRILELCHARKISVNKLATMSGLRQSTIDSLLKGTAKNPTLRTLHKIATGFCMTVSDFLDFPELNELSPDEEGK